MNLFQRGIAGFEKKLVVGRNFKSDAPERKAERLSLIKN
jgi:hypothetical protein